MIPHECDPLLLLLIGSSDSSVEQWIAQTEEKLRLAGQQHKAAVAVKHDWYQTESQVIVSILAKNVDPSGVQVDYTSSAVRLYSITVSFPIFLLQFLFLFKNF